MKSADIVVGRRYTAKVSGRLVPVEIEAVYTVERRTRAGVRFMTTWQARNTVTGRTIQIKSPQRFRREAQGGGEAS